ncbi:MAG: diguanylate cyclase [Thermodesulfobacteriota bacterium]
MHTVKKTDSAFRHDRVLIVGDDREASDRLKGLLGVHGYATRQEPPGRDVLGVIDEWRPAVVLLDIAPPEMEGGELCEMTKSVSPPNRPSIVVTFNKGDRGVIEDGISFGADDFLMKPVNERELVTTVGAQIRIREIYSHILEDKKNLETVLAISGAVSSTMDSSKVLDIIVKKVAEITDAVRCSIVLITKDTEGKVLASHDEPIKGDLKIDLSKYPEIKEVMATRHPLALEDMAEHPLMSGVTEHMEQLKGMSILVVPLVFNKEVLGTLFLRAMRFKKGFTRREIELCRSVASASYNAIRNVQLFEKIQKEKEHLKEMAITDQLTSLYNHSFFYTRLEEEFQRAVRYSIPLSLIMMDIDDFKKINDNYGHRTGDLVLKEIGTMIKNCVRKTDIVARYGGEEFSVVLPQTTLEGAAEEAERIREFIGKHNRYVRVGKENITVSMGVASYPAEGVTDAEDLVNLADKALYEAKNAGKNCVRITVRGKKG